MGVLLQLEVAILKWPISNLSNEKITNHHENESVICLGVGLDFNGELKLQKRHNQCRFLVVDPDERNLSLIHI